MRHAFRRRNAQALYEAHIGPNMTPMVDVVMVILIFFMASTAFLGPEWFLRTNLPVVGTGPPAPEPEPTRLRVALKAVESGPASVVVGDGAPIDLAALDALITSEAARVSAENLIVLIAPEDGVAYDDVVRVHETCARLGVSKVGLLEGEKRVAPAGDVEPDPPG